MITTDKEVKRHLIKLISVFVSLLMAAVFFAAQTFGWFALKRTLAPYAPIARPEALFIGAGHRNFDAEAHEFKDSHFEDIIYLYLSGIDAKADKEYYDYVFCVYGKMISGFNLQLGYTTNNQFTYKIYSATETDTQPTGENVEYVAYTTHTESPETFYYTPARLLTGDFLNDQTVGEETLADNTEHTATYGSYNNVNKYAEPLYWQTSSAEPGYARGDFINYYILRVYLNGKTVNDRETDVICITAKSATYTGS
ncbi:MAG: hypothetical protein IJT49_10030 [Clostridia bacterium]|nr:hypothetical protein [Clostridia bacterium]